MAAKEPVIGSDAQGQFLALDFDMRLPSEASVKMNAEIADRGGSGKRRTEKDHWRAIPTPHAEGNVARLLGVNFDVPCATPALQRLELSLIHI